MKTVAETQDFLSALSCCCNDVEIVALEQACGRVAATLTLAPLNIPPEDNSAMDGIAINCSDFKTAPSSMMISQRIPAGLAPRPLAAGTAARIFTGGVIPENADCVVIQENCEFVGDDRVVINSSPKPGDNIRPHGQDIRKGAQVISAGQILTPIDVSLLSSIGVAELAVRQRLRVAIFSTGDELVEPGTPLKSGQIYNSNRILLKLLCRQFEVDVIDVGLVEDTLEATKVALADAAQRADLIISSGGVSVGEEDHVKPAVEQLGRLDLWKVQMKPGKPVAFGRIGDSAFIGLPGNPVSSFVVFQLLGVPLIRALQGAKIERPRVIPIRASFNKPHVTREEYIRVRISLNDGGETSVERFGNLSSGVLSSLSWADGLVKQGANNAICAGDLVDFLPLRNSSLW
ncbi:MAG TPA: molybdopterin molybdenumtransferase MoeA [Gammaproteobacteria bacterium]|nr:molybdopterin molybdenumtransferase MoeA [Gammaproteobacteria bacterium]